MYTPDRKSSYKLPPTTIRDKLISQEARRSKALEEQKRRRAQRVDSTRQLDLFAGLNLGASDNEDDHEEGEQESAVNITPASVARYAAMLEPDIPPNAITSFDSAHGVTQSSLPPSAATSATTTLQQEDGSSPPVTKKKGKRKANNKNRSNKTSKWADKCMYAELLEMSADDPWSDGLPTDLESGWVAVAPIPVGKRCLAVTHQSSGVAGVVPNTTLRSRLLGKTLINRFPSTLPPLTILDCILDANWRDNGILHVLDVVKWKGQDVGDCEAPFRFWWRDTRLAELSHTHPPNINFLVNSPSPSSADSGPHSSEHARYHFPYPTTFVPVPYHTNTSLSALDTHIIPSAREARLITVDVPVLDSSSSASFLPINAPAGDSVMDVELTAPQNAFSTQTFGSTSALASTFTFHSSLPTVAPARPIGHAPLVSVEMRVQPDGLLLYVSEASFEPGTSPLSSWIPIVGYGDVQVEAGDMGMDVGGKGRAKEGPLDLFQRLVRRRLERVTHQPALGSLATDIDMDF
ncbi:hypothetical protein B0H34DRAFT_710095 [Crassisporium funariophilum]|nr:hypothetical protein B0H34DRAFT_710095 [Crassisporium funariophilum]